MGYPYVCGFCNHDDMVSLYLNTALIGIPRLEAVPVFPGDPGVHRAVQQQRTRGDDHIVQAHGQNRRGDQGVAEADQPFDQIGQQLRGKDKQCG